MNVTAPRRRSKAQCADDDDPENGDDGDYDKIGKRCSIELREPSPAVEPIKDSVSSETIERINDMVEPAYVRDVKDALSGRFAWKRISEVCETSSKVLSGVSSIFAFAAGAYKYASLSFTAGCIGTVALVFMLFASYAAKESKERTQQLNMTLNHVGIRGMPVIAIDPGVPETAP